MVVPNDHKPSIHQRHYGGYFLLTITWEPYKCWPDTPSYNI